MPTPEQCAVTDTKITGIDREIVALRARQDRLEERLDELRTMMAQVRAFVAGILVLSLLPESFLDILK
mgnify:FL=1|jgi:prefoldin subunit 5